MTPEPFRVWILGRGRVGKALASALIEAEEPALTVTLTRARRLPRGIDADVIVLAVPDAAIGSVSGAVVERLAPEASPVLLHCAGSLGLEAYGDLPAHAPSVTFGALHPLVSFADPARPPPLRETSAAIAGSPRARTAAARLIAILGIDPLVRGRRGVQGPAYHAAAALVANGAASLAFVGVGVLRDLGLSKRDSERALGALLESVGRNVKRVGVPRALTGPVMRGDHETVRRHRRALGRGTDARRAYDALVPVIERCAAALQRKRK